MDLDNEPAPGGEVVETVKDEKAEKEEKPKKKVVIDENKQVRQIENTRIDKQNKPKSQIRQNIETTTWPWRISCLSFILGFIFHVISYGTPHWIIIDIPPDGEMRAGFWGACVEGSGCSFRNATTGSILILPKNRTFLFRKHIIHHLYTLLFVSNISYASNCSTFSMQWLMGVYTTCYSYITTCLFV